MSEFIWKGVRQLSRKGIVLEPDKVYKTKEFGEDIVAVWIKSGHAKKMSAPKKDKSEVK